MNGMLNAANRNSKSIDEHFDRSASPGNRISEETYSQHSVHMPYTFRPGIIDYFPGEKVAEAAVYRNMQTQHATHTDGRNMRHGQHGYAPGL